jgi:hypothetical protein
MLRRVQTASPTARAKRIEALVLILAEGKTSAASTGKRKSADGDDVGGQGKVVKKGKKKR